MEQQPGILWTTKNTYVDIDTGEILTALTANNKRKYIILKKIKNVRINQLQTKGIVSYTNHCRKQPQGELSFN